MKQKNSLTISLINFNTFAVPFFSENIFQRYKAMTDYFEKSDTNFLCLQEIFNYPSYFHLKKNLPSYNQIIYKPFILGPKGGLVTCSKLPVQKIEYIPFSRRGPMHYIESFGAILIQNGLLVTYLKNHPVAIINTHLTTNIEFDWDKDSKLYEVLDSQVEDLDIIIKNLISQNISCIVTGDLNIGKNTHLYKKIIEKMGAIDVFKEFSFPTYRHDKKEFFFKGKKSDRIDYVLLFPNKHTYTIQQKDHIFTEEVTLPNKKKTHISDHIGLKATINVTY